ncbi:hypothetical protein FRC01_011051, partial [Tulasnella sp. 417]
PSITQKNTSSNRSHRTSLETPKIPTGNGSIANSVFGAVITPAASKATDARRKRVTGVFVISAPGPTTPTTLGKTRWRAKKTKTKTKKRGKAIRTIMAATTTTTAPDQRMIKYVNTSTHALRAALQRKERQKRRRQLPFEKTAPKTTRTSAAPEPTPIVKAKPRPRPRERSKPGSPAPSSSTRQARVERPEPAVETSLSSIKSTPPTAQPKPATRKAPPAKRKRVVESDVDHEDGDATQTQGAGPSNSSPNGTRSDK